MADVGRPTVMIPEVLVKIEEELLNGATFVQASFLAKISLKTLYNYWEEHPEFRERCELLQNMPSYLARKNVVEKIHRGDIQESHYWLDRKDKEFKPKSDITTDDEPLPMLIKFINGKENTDDTNTTGVPTPISE